MSKIDNASAYDSGIYDSNIVNVLPFYMEFHAQVMDLVKAMPLRPFQSRKGVWETVLSAKASGYSYKFNDFY